MGPTPRQTAGYREKWSNWANALEEPPARLRGGPHQGPQTRPGVWPHGKTHSALDVSRERRNLAEPPLVNLRLMLVDRADLRLPRMVPGAGPPRGSASSRLCGNAPTSLGCHRARPLPPGGPLFGYDSAVMEGLRQGHRDHRAAELGGSRAGDRATGRGRLRRSRSDGLAWRDRGCCILTFDTSALRRTMTLWMCSRWESHVLI